MLSLECAAQLLGKVKLEGESTDSKLSQCIHNMKATSDASCKLRFDWEGLSATKQDGSKLVLGVQDLISCRMLTDHPRTVVWIIYELENLYILAVKCHSEQEALDLFHIYHEISVRLKMEQLGLAKTVKENLDPSKNAKIINKVLPAETKDKETPGTLRETKKPQRQVLIAATKAYREKPPETRQREPAKLLAPVKVAAPIAGRPAANAGDNKQILRWEPPKNNKVAPNAKVLSSSPVSYARWVQNSGSGNPQMSRGAVRHVLIGGSVVRDFGRGTISLGTTRMHPRLRPSLPREIINVNRAVSVNSHGSEGPKSALKKPRTYQPNKKNVTFNAFATVQLVKV